MNNEFNTMMKEMVQTMMMSMMKETMQEMMSEMVGTKPQVANAVAVAEKSPKTMSREDFLAIQEEPVVDVNLEPIELVVYENKGLKFNRPVSSDIWTINYLTLKSKYPNVKYDKNSHGFRWNKADTNEFRVACRDYQVITEITKEHAKKIKEYKLAKAERAKNRANDYYNSLAK